MQRRIAASKLGSWLVLLVPLDGHWKRQWVLKSAPFARFVLAKFELHLGGRDGL